MQAVHWSLTENSQFGIKVTFLFIYIALRNINYLFFRGINIFLLFKAAF